MKNTIFRSASGLLLISITLIAGVLAPVRAEGESVCAEIGLTSLDERVVIDEAEDCIYVMPHPTRSEQFISSELLAGSYLSSRRYSLSYADADMNEAESENVLGGYIRAEYKREGGAVYYIPVKAYKSGEYTAVYGEDMYTSLDGGSASGTVNGLGGRAADKTAVTLTPPETGLTRWDSMQHSFTSIDLDGAALDNSRTFSFEFNAYADGNTILRLNCDYSGESNVFMRWLEDGTVEVNNDGAMTAAGELRRGAWHRLAISYDSVRHRYMLFADGRLLCDNSPFWTGGARICYGIDSGSSTGRAAFSDLKYYYGYYYPTLYYRLAQLGSESEDTVVDEEKNAIYTAKNGGIERLISVLSADGAYIGSGEGEIREGTMIVTETEDNIIGSYVISSPVFCESIEFTDAGAEAVLKNKLANEISAVMIMTERNEAGIITSVSASDQQVITTDGAVFRIEKAREDSVKREVFFITGWDTRTALLDAVFGE